MKEARHCLYSGDSGWGKSYHAGADFEDLVIDESFFGIIVDIKPTNKDDEIGDHRGVSEDLDFVRIHIDSAQDIHDASLEDFKELLEDAKRLGKNGVRFTADITIPEVEDAIPMLVDKLCRAVMRLNFPTVVLLEEVQFAAPHSQKGGSMDDFRGLISLLGLGRTSNKIGMMTTQAFTKVHKSIYGQCNLYKIRFMGKKYSAYDKVLDPRKDEEDREAIDEIVASDKEDRLYIYYDSNEGITEVRSSKSLNRVTRHID